MRRVIDKSERSSSLVYVLGDPSHEGHLGPEVGKHAVARRVQRMDIGIVHVELDADAVANTRRLVSTSRHL